MMHKFKILTQFFVVTTVCIIQQSEIRGEPQTNYC